MRKPVPTPIFGTFWRFAAARQDAFFARIAKPTSWPWSPDPIIQRHKFTNAYRAADRVSQYLIRNVIYAGDQAVDEVFFRTLLFKIFNKIETWEMLTTGLGEISWASYSRARTENLLTTALLRGETIFSAAYIMPTRSGDLASHRKHVNFLDLLERMMADRLPERVDQAQSLHHVYKALRDYPLLGDFLAFQLTIDLLYGPSLTWEEDHFVVAGPGALSGIAKCFSDTAGLTPAEVIRWTTERQEEEFERLGLTFQSLWGRRLHLIDVQNLFCEVNKYARVAHPEVIGIDARVKIKQSFAPSRSPLRFWFPPKWEINDQVPEIKGALAPARRAVQEALF